MNVHWFCDKLNLTGSTLQAINGVFLVATFFGCRLVWGIWNSFIVFQDQLGLHLRGHTNYSLRHLIGKTGPPYTVQQLLDIRNDKLGQLHAFNKEQYVPLWIPVVYLISNLTLNSLNVFWFGKMIETIRTRFDPPFGTKSVGPNKVYYQPQLKDSQDSDLGIGAPGKVHEKKESPLLDGSPDSASESPAPEATAGAKAVKGSVRAARKKAEERMNGPVGSISDTRMEDSGTLADSDAGSGAEATGTQRRSGRRRKA